jgi:hypothetical protein
MDVHKIIQDRRRLRAALALLVKQLEIENVRNDSNEPIQCYEAFRDAKQVLKEIPVQAPEI